MNKVHILIDYENLPLKELKFKDNLQAKVFLFLGANQSRLPFTLVEDMQKLGSDGKYIKLENGGKNALDFHISYYLGRMTESAPMIRFVILSKDTGFDPLIEHLKLKGFNVCRVAKVEQIYCA